MAAKTFQFGDVVVIKGQNKVPLTISPPPSGQDTPPGRVWVAQASAATILLHILPIEILVPKRGA